MATNPTTDRIVKTVHHSGEYPVSRSVGLFSVFIVELLVLVQVSAGGQD